jgi:hypothetical protein
MIDTAPHGRRKFYPSPAVLLGASMAFAQPYLWWRYR